MMSRGAIEAKSPAVVGGIVRAGDAVVLVLAGLVAYVARHGVDQPPFSYVVVMVIGVLLVANAFAFAGLYRAESFGRLTPQLARLAIGLPVVFLMLVALGFFTKTSEDFSRVWVVLWLFLALVGLAAWRAVVRSYVREWQAAGVFGREIAVVGAGEPGRRLVEHLAVAHDPSLRIVGIYDDRRTRVPGSIGGVPVLGTIEDLVELARRVNIDTIVVALPWTSTDRVSACLEKLRLIPANVQLCPDVLRLGSPFRGVSSTAGVPMIKVYDRPLSGWSYFVKAAEDRLVALLLLTLALPLFAVIAVLIRLDSAGPVFFRQQRFGFNNNVFTVYKFRTMVHGGPPEPNVPQARRGDPRVTRVGAFLRRHSLDELPQLFNVLMGEMSVVGPRPHAVAHNQSFAPVINGYLARHRVKPGITGWAQVNGLRGETQAPESMAARVQHDLFYIDNWSLLFDLRIIALTAIVGFSGKHAY
ncbi:MAG: undecaprenyl-phosphate glucose phosphotransferase [Alphaproteobacteria bacterium]